jgi:hypothetical protein
MIPFTLEAKLTVGQGDSLDPRVYAGGNSSTYESRSDQRLVLLGSGTATAAIAGAKGLLIKYTLDVVDEEDPIPTANVTVRLNGAVTGTTLSPDGCIATYKSGITAVAIDYTADCIVEITAVW